ncbi:MAG TPA: ABC transporter permease [Puia sp.]|nr:ABC transporter permease [Puia sp.]
MERIGSAQTFIDKQEPVDNHEHWDLVLKPQSSSFELHLAEIWRYRDLLWLFVKRDFVSFYKQTILGPLWFFIQPLFTTVIYTFVFGGLASISTDGIPQPLFFMAGITAWNYFADCITKTSTVFRDNVNIFGKVYFPRIIMPLSLVVSNLIRFAVQMILFLITMAWYYWGKGASFHATPYILLFPFIVLLMGLLGLGFGMIVSAMTTRYRDLAFLVLFGVQLMMYGTTVVYPLSAVVGRFQKHPILTGLIEYNPLTAIIETFRVGFLGSGTFTWGLLAYATGATLFIFLLGIFTFNRVEKNFVDTI